jgi:hypothetical protein
MISQLSKKIELKFWDAVIPLLSNSTWLRTIAKRMSDLYHDEQIVRHIAIGLVIAFAGFACGFLIFSLGTIFS